MKTTVEFQLKHYIEAYLRASENECAAIYHCHHGRQVCNNPALKAWTTRRFRTLRTYYMKHFPEDTMQNGLIKRIGEYQNAKN